MPINSTSSGLGALTAKGPDSIPDRGTRIPQAARCDPKQERNRWTNRSRKDPEKARGRIRRKWCFLYQRTGVSKKSNHVNKNTKGSKKKLGLKEKKCPMDSFVKILATWK